MKQEERRNGRLSHEDMNCSFLYSTIAIYPEMHLFGKSGYGEGLTLLLDAVDKGVTK